MILITVLASTLRVSTPLIFSALGGFFSEKSGVINIALEGMMLIGAFSAAVVTVTTHSPDLGLLAGGLAGAVLAFVYAFTVLHFRADQVVAGIAINFLASGLTPFLCKLLYGVTGSTPQIPVNERYTIFPVVLAWILVVLVYLMNRFTKWGLWIRFAGEHPSALETAGISKLKVRWACVVTSGFLAGLGGASLSIFLSSSFSRQMTAGRGFMAIAALIFGKWKPLPAALTCLLFGFVDALQIQLQGVVLWGIEPVPVQFIQILPYCLTVLVLAGFVGQSRAPKSLGTL